MSESSPNYLLTDQVPPDASLQQRSSMFHVSQEYPAGNDSYRLNEIAAGHLVLRAQPDNASVLAAVKQTTGLDLPLQPLTSAANDQYCLYWIAPDEWLLLIPEKTEFEVERKLRQEATGHYAIINVSGAQTLLELSGEWAEAMLKKTAAYDVHISQFPVGKVVTTVCAKTQAVLRRTGDDAFQIIVRRSFSDYLWQWLVDAGSRP